MSSLAVWSRNQSSVTKPVKDTRRFTGALAFCTAAAAVSGHLG
jgi:hypothetical protein